MQLRKGNLILIRLLFAYFSLILPILIRQSVDNKSQLTICELRLISLSFYTS